MRSQRGRAASCQRFLAGAPVTGLRRTRSGGGRGVGIGTTRAVVIGSVTTLVMDYFLTDILLSVLGTGKGH